MTQNENTRSHSTINMSQVRRSLRQLNIPPEEELDRCFICLEDILTTEILVKGKHAAESIYTSHVTEDQGMKRGCVETVTQYLHVHDVQELLVIEDVVIR